MVETGVTDLVHHTITARLETPRLRESFRALRTQLENLDGPQALVSVWGPEDCNGAVAVAVPYGATPLIVHRARRLWGDLAVQPCWRAACCS